MKEKTRAFYKAVFKYWWNERVLKFFRKIGVGTHEEM